MGDNGIQSGQKLDLRNQAGMESLWQTFRKTDEGLRGSVSGNSPFVVELGGEKVELYHPLEGIFSRKFQPDSRKALTAQVGKFGGGPVTKFYGAHGNQLAVLRYESAGGGLRVVTPDSSCTPKDCSFETIRFVEGTLNRVSGRQVMIVSNEERKAAQKQYISTLAKNVIDPEVSMLERQKSLLALGGLGKAAGSAVPQVIKALRNPDSRIRQTAAQVLGEIGDQTSDPVVKGAKLAVIPLSLTLISDPDASVRETAAQSLGRYRREAADVSIRLARALTDDNSPNVRTAAARALEDIVCFGEECLKNKPVQPVIDKLTQALSDPDFFVREAAARALNYFGHLDEDYVAKVAGPQLIKALNDPDTGVRREATRSLWIGGDAAVPYLIPLLSDPSPRTRVAAVQALGGTSARFASPPSSAPLTSVIPYLGKALEDASPRVRLEVIRALENIQEIPSIKRQREVAKSTDAEYLELEKKMERESEELREIVRDLINAQSDSEEGF